MTGARNSFVNSREPEAPPDVLNQDLAFGYGLNEGYDHRVEVDRVAAGGLLASNSVPGEPREESPGFAGHGDG